MESSSSKIDIGQLGQPEYKKGFDAESESPREEGFDAESKSPREEGFDAKLFRPMEISVIIPSSIDATLRPKVIEKIYTNVDKICKGIQASENPQGGINFIVETIKEKYKVLSLLRLICTIYINYGIRYTLKELIITQSSKESPPIEEWPPIEEKSLELTKTNKLFKEV